MTQPPIIPGNPQPEEPTSWQEIGPPMYEPYIPPRPAPAPVTSQPSPTQDTVKKAAVGTVTVIVVLVAIFCILPTLACGIMAALGGMSPNHPY